MDKNTSKRVLFLTGSILITTIAAVLVIASLCFFAGIGISAWQFPVSFLLTGAIFFYIGKSYYRVVNVFLKSFLIALIIIVVAVIIAVNFYDLSYDGQTYHMETIALLKNGWNPFKSLLHEENYLYVYINHYPRAVELPESTLYSLIGHIEAGKATNIILLSATFCLSLSFLLNFKKLSVLKSVLLSLIATFNPVAVNQLISTYVDGQLALLLLCFFITALCITKEVNYANLLLLGSAIIIIVNIKFTALVYIVIFTLAFLGTLLFFKNAALLKKAFYTTVIAGIVAIGIVGYHPYIINTVKFDHPFYPLMGENKQDIIQVNIPKGLEDRSRVDKFFTSLFAHTDNLMNDNKRAVRFKIPFTFNMTDIASASKIDARVAGFGPMFSGIFLLSFIMLVVLLIMLRNDIRIIKNLLYFLMVVALSVFILPEAWWARYVPQLWYIPVIIFMAAELYAPVKFKLLKVLLYIAFLINIGFTFIGFGWNFMMTSLVNHQLQELKASKKPIAVQWDICSTNRIRFQENNIPYIEKDLRNATNIKAIIRSNSIYVADTSVNIPKSKFIKWAEKYRHVSEHNN